MSRDPSIGLPGVTGSVSVFGVRDPTDGDLAVGGSFTVRVTAVSFIRYVISSAFITDLSTSRTKRDSSSLPAI